MLLLSFENSTACKSYFTHFHRSGQTEDEEEKFFFFHTGLSCCSFFVLQSTDCYHSENIVLQKYDVDILNV